MSRQPLWSPRPGPGVCVDCFTFIEPGFTRCLVCAAMPRALVAMVPIAYSIHGGDLHHDIASYKRDADPSVGDTSARLAQLLAQFLEGHERCLATVAGVKRFQHITVVPSRHDHAGARHPLASLLATGVPAVNGRFRELLRHTSAPIRLRHFDPGRFIATADLRGSDVLLVDDMWTSGASAHSAAAVLRAAGAERVAALVVGRHLNRRRFEPESLLARRAVPLSIDECAYCRAARAIKAKPAAARVGDGGSQVITA